VNLNQATMGALDQQWSRLLGSSADGDVQGGARVVAWHVPAAASACVGQVWAGVQAELPAPAIAVDGEAGWLLCFALPAAKPRDEARQVLTGLIQRVLTQADAGVPPTDVAGWRFTCWPLDGDGDGDDDGAAATEASAWPVPRLVGPDRWSAFVAPDLVPVFADTPWLDCAPSEDGQAVLLSRLQAISAADWQRLLAEAAPVTAPANTPVATTATSRLTDAESGLGRQALPPVADDPRAFLRAVMNDTSVEMALRIEAARVLLAHG